MLWGPKLSRFVLLFLVSMMMILTGVTQLSALTRQAVVAGHDGTVINDVWSYQRLLTLGVGGSRLASALIERGQETLIVDSDKPSSDIDVPNSRPPS